HGPYLTALAEVYRRSAALAPLATVERDQANLEPANADHLLDLAETLLGLDRPDDTRAVLRRAREQGTWRSPRYLALAGRAALARGEYRSAAGLLGRALDANHADPELRAELALALEGIGERQQAPGQARWPRPAPAGQRPSSTCSRPTPSSAPSAPRSRAASAPFPSASAPSSTSPCSAP